MNPLCFLLASPVYSASTSILAPRHNYTFTATPSSQSALTSRRTSNTSYTATAKPRHTQKSSIVRTPPTGSTVKTKTKSPSSIPNVGESATRQALEVLYEAAKYEEKSGRVINALRMYESLVRLHPTNGRAWVRYVSAVLKSDSAIIPKKLSTSSHTNRKDTYSNPKSSSTYTSSSDRARAILKRAVKYNPGNAIIWQTWADLEKSEEHFDVARKLFQKALQASSHLPSLYHSWGGMEYKIGNVGLARRLYQEGLRRCPTTTRLFHALGILHDKHGNVKSARIILTQGLKLEPDNPFLHHALGVSNYRTGKVSAARECFTRAIRVDPRHTMSWLSFALLEELEGNIDLARKYYAKGTTVDSVSSHANTVQLWQAWARMEEKAGDKLRALQLYRKAIVHHPSDSMLYCSWGKLVESMGEIESARKIFSEGLMTKGGRKKAYLWQSIALLEQRQMNFDTARRIFAHGVASSNRGTEQVPLVHAWAAMEWEQGDFERARQLFNQAIVIDDGCPWLWLWFGRFELAQDRTCIARHYIQRSINLDPCDGSPWRVWAELERTEGNEENARIMFKRAAQLESSTELFQMDPESPLKRPWRKI